jgi:3alpha(or 20beta)-hydroxysteroid dehydrogenase
MSGRLEGKIALITGAARGQGAAEVRAFVAEGARVIVADILVDEAKRLAEECDGMAVPVHLDVTDEQAWENVVADVRAEHGHLDVLINNAGILALTPIESTSLAEYQRIIAVNQVGVFLGMRACIPLLAERGGSIVNVSSIGGLAGMPMMLAYVASKFAVRGMTRTAAVELASRRIRVNSIHPGGVETPMLEELGLPPDLLTQAAPLGRLAKPEEIASLVTFLASDESGYCTGGEFVIDGGLTAGIPLPSGSPF